MTLSTAIAIGVFIVWVTIISSLLYSAYSVASQLYHRIRGDCRGRVPSRTFDQLARNYKALYAKSCRQAREIRCLETALVNAQAGHEAPIDLTKRTN